MTDASVPVPDEPVNEYEREPGPEKAWLGFKSFVGQYAGEHTAGTELMIGPLSVFRHARMSRYGLATGAGMDLGHFLAWIATSILCALQLYRDPGNTAVLPGPLAKTAAGITGLLCVIVACWTTASPTISRAGLAFQAIFPRSSRYKVTLITVQLRPFGFINLPSVACLPLACS